ncbi:MAG: hypothetical protein Q4A01_03620 [Coriobacteriales bacterium]|nr:hypothetical protein [Coriobacteriales bacterium]
MSTQHIDKPTPLFLSYVVRLFMRLALFGVGVWLFLTQPALLDITTQFGPASGLSFVNVVFAFLLLDLISKLRPNAKIAMGSRKQYGEFHVPTPRMFPGGLSDLREHASELLEQALNDTRKAVRETAEGILAAGRQLAYTIDVLRLLSWPDEDLTADDLLKEDIRKHRLHEIVPVIVFWVVFNVAVGLLLERFGLFSPQTALLWLLFYFVFDMVCVVLWCPLQLVLMRNRCCTTCQIFNWDGIMTVTPLLAVGCLFSWILIALALIVLVRWELAFARHPERFDERTNASLQCANCSDKLCYLRRPLAPRKR